MTPQTSYYLAAGRVRSTGWETWYSGPLVVNRWEQCRFRCRSDFAHLLPLLEPPPDFRPKGPPAYGLGI